MVNDKLVTNNKPGRNQAEMVGRNFNVAMNSAILYSSTHPTTLKNVKALFSNLVEVLRQHESLSLIVHRDELFIEEWSINGTLNPRRLIQQFNRIGIISVTFFRGVTQSELEIFIQAAGDIRSEITVATIDKILQKHRILAIKINYVRYGKIISDQKPNCSESKSELPAVDKINGFSAGIHEKLRESCSQIITGNNAEAGTLEIIQHIKDEVESVDPHALSDLLNTLHDIKNKIAEAVECSRLNGKVISTDNLVTAKLDELKSETVLRLIKQEYNCGAISIRRLAQIIHRILPDLRELRNLLPKLKKMLLSEGMAVADYLDLLKTLNIEIDSDSISDSLESAAESVGVTVAEIIDAIKKDPDDAARLIVLASEIRKGCHDEDLQLSTMLTEYVEKASSALVMKKDSVNENNDGNVLRKLLTNVEDQLICKLNESGISNGVVSKIKQKLTDNFETTLDSVTTEWLVKMCTENQSRDPSELAENITQFVEHQSQFSRIQKTLFKSLMETGYSADTLQKMLSQVISAAQKPDKLVLPSSALSTNNMLFLLNREIGQHKRYGTPFSTMIYTIESITVDDKVRKADNDEKKQLMIKLFDIVKKHLREIDLLGTIAIPDTYSLFSIMTMTNFEGATIVKNRVLAYLKEKKFQLKGVSCSIDVVISVDYPHPQNIKGLRTFLNSVKQNHHKAVLMYNDPGAKL